MYTLEGHPGIELLKAWSHSLHNEDGSLTFSPLLREHLMYRAGTKEVGGAI